MCHLTPKIELRYNFYVLINHPYATLYITYHLAKVMEIQNSEKRVWATSQVPAVPVLMERQPE